MEVVINGCFGGFGLSYEAIKEIMRRKGMECYGYQRQWTGTSFTHDYVRYDKMRNDIFKYDLFYCFAKDFGDKISADKFNNLLQKEIYFNEYSFDEDKERTDPDLVAVVKEMGKKASGHYANLYVVEIPDDVNWRIDEYDGSETVEEVHRSWC